jgi:hypothetical protein
MLVATDVTRGIRDDALAQLDKRTRDIVIRLLARVAELSYRRGAQQGAYLAENHPQRLPKDMSHWRYSSRSLDRAPWLDGDFRQTSIDRLFTENGGLRRIGLWEHDVGSRHAAAGAEPARAPVEDRDA